MGAGSREGGLGLEFREHDRLGPTDQAKRLLLQGKFYEADLTDWDIIMGNHFMASNGARALPHPATLLREAAERLSWLLTHCASSGSQWTGDEGENILRAVKAAGIKSQGSNGQHLQVYGLSCETYQWEMEASGMEVPLTDVFA